MAYVRSHRYPCPEVFDAGDGYLVMQRLDGPTLLGYAMPLHIRRSALVLAGLHEQLHAIPAPDWLPKAPIPGDAVLHRDLHPLNVLMTHDGPVVIDWANAARGDASYDVADTWTVFACAEASDLPPHERLLAPLARRMFLRAFLGALDSDSARRAIPAVVEHRRNDRNMSPAEVARMAKLADRARAAL